MNQIFLFFFFFCLTVETIFFFLCVFKIFVNVDFTEYIFITVVKNVMILIKIFFLSLFSIFLFCLFILSHRSNVSSWYGNERFLIDHYYSSILCSVPTVCLHIPGLVPC